MKVLRALGRLFPAALNSLTCRVAGHEPDPELPRLCGRCGVYPI